MRLKPVQIQYQKHLSRQFGIAYDLYVAVLGEVDTRVNRALERESKTWRIRHTCPACTYTLKDEKSLLFSLLFAMDGNNSLKRLLLRRPSVDDPSKPGPSCERPDSRSVPGDVYVSREAVNRWSQELVGAVKALEEDVRDPFMLSAPVSSLNINRIPTTILVPNVGRT